MWGCLTMEGLCAAIESIAYLSGSDVHSLFVTGNLSIALHNIEQTDMPVLLLTHYVNI